jgi:hypothetical protein
MKIKEENYLSLRELNERLPKMFGKHTLKSLLRHREKNGFKKCLIQVGKKFYVDMEELSNWVNTEHQRDD